MLIVDLSLFGIIKLQIKNEIRKEEKTMKNNKGFTIVELVIVIAVIAILAAVLIPTFSGVVGRANTSAAVQECRTALTNVLSGNASQGQIGKAVFIVEGKHEYEYNGSKLITVNDDGTEVDTKVKADLISYVKETSDSFDSNKVYFTKSGEVYSFDNTVTSENYSTKKDSLYYSTTKNNYNTIIIKGATITAQEKKSIAAAFAIEVSGVSDVTASQGKNIITVTKDGATYTFTALANSDFSGKLAVILQGN